MKHLALVTALLIGLSATHSLASDEEPPPYPLEWQKKECLGVLSDKQKLWLYEARARKVVPPFSAEWCRIWNLPAFTDVKDGKKA